ncbi:16S rRNA (cytosine(1402)-N(4))-methyltransferase RsmH [Ignatzschineria rhizosphaerae]|uniref:Ribosomal RNA small subunit methyltransferase H n=1 Tax=Ignatzschineria rhizosphaerae TaxID=2923279 RepID=A0ABY3X968_9GAMM|nr:16S rRNA (cytosine(1402)-N(4))-methyltransferase RsmH [Ignatzschineria rhizosphaerae]UNM96513.1 16S rRNA (cytosine(1402)-N(4))-methyltransferase RsmH [Ignatzschineria rhizosphaerae]
MSNPPNKHISVLLNESIEALNINPSGIYVDATFGRGGHSREILQHLNPEGLLIGIDRDLTAEAYAHEHFAKYPNFKFVRGEMGNMLSLIRELGIEHVDGILMDIGVSSPQLDEAKRGFSFMKEGPLDMRMDQAASVSAEDWIAETEVEAMAHAFKAYGEERFSGRVARAIDEYRQEKRITSTLELAEIVSNAMPFKEGRIHPATRVFQAIRIAVNGELDQLESALSHAVELLGPEGRLAVISFHSLEDRIVKHFMREQSTVKDLYPDLPVLISAGDAALKVIGKPIKASDEECRENVRSRSAILRVAKRVL